MISEVNAIPFDHYQRYRTATGILQTLGLEEGGILEVGANRQRLLSAFLPQARLLYTDIRLEGGERDFVIADATALPFASGCFDAVVSLDVLEHIPSTLRAAAVSEMARVARRAVIIGCPTNEDWVVQADRDANARWRELFGGDYEWLKEHDEFGLVDGTEVVSTLQEQGLKVVQSTHGDAALWVELMGSHFVKVKYPELEDLSEAADCLYNTRVFDGDHSNQPYRRYFVGLRDRGDAATLAQKHSQSGDVDSEAKHLLEKLASGLRSFALRTLNAESEWASTAERLGLSERNAAEAVAAWKLAADLCAQKDRDLSVATREWQATVDSLKQAKATTAEAESGWKSAMELCAQKDRDLSVAIREWQATVDLLKQAEATAAEAGSGWKSAVELCAQKDRDLSVATQEWQATVDLLKQAEATAAEAGSGWKSAVELCAQKDREYAAASRLYTSRLAMQKKKFTIYGTVALIVAFAAGAMAMRMLTF